MTTEASYISGLPANCRKLATKLFDLLGEGTKRLNIALGYSNIASNKINKLVSKTGALPPPPVIPPLPPVDNDVLTDCAFYACFLGISAIDINKFTSTELFDKVIRTMNGLTFSAHGTASTLIFLAQGTLGNAGRLVNKLASKMAGLLLEPLLKMIDDLLDCMEGVDPTIGNVDSVVDFRILRQTVNYDPATGLPELDIDTPSKSALNSLANTQAEFKAQVEVVQKAKDDARLEY